MDGNVDIELILVNLGALVVAYGLAVVGGVALFLAGRWLAARVRATTRSRLERSRMDPTLIPFAAGLVYWGLMAFVVLAVLNLVGVQTASAIAVLGAAGLAVGLALQGTLSNFAAGVMLLTFRPFQVGDWVDVATVSGTVREIGLFSSVLHSGDNIRVIVPNSQIYGHTIKNYSANPTRRIDLVMGVSYDDDLAEAQRTMERVLAEDERVLAEPAALVAVDELADSSVNFVVRPWCNAPDYWTVRRDVTRRMKEELEAAGCSIPFPQRDVHLHQAG